MSRLIRSLTRRGPFAPAIMTIGIAVVAVSFLVVAPASPDDDAGPSILVLAIVGLFLIPAVITALRFGFLLAGVDPEADLIAQGLVAGDDQQRLVSRWLQRTRWARNVGGLAGLTWWIFGTSLQGDVLLCGIGGLALGSIAAQLHHVGRARGLRTASLERRSLRDYQDSGWHRRLLAVAGVAAALTVAGLLLDSNRAAVYGTVGVVAVGSTHLVQRRVVARARPALSTGLTTADDLARALAIDRGLAQPAIYLALVLIAHGALGLERDLGGLATLISVVAWLTALVAWWRNRRLGLDFVLAPHRVATAA